MIAADASAAKPSPAAVKATRNAAVDRARAAASTRMVVARTVTAVPGTSSTKVRAAAGTDPYTTRRMTVLPSGASGCQEVCYRSRFIVKLDNAAADAD